MTESSWRRIDWVVAGLAVCAIAAHDYAHIEAGRYYDTFWICNVSALVVGPAVFLRNAPFAFVGFAWLLPGTVVWLVDAFAAGSTILPTSYAVHLGGSAAAAYGVFRAGYSRYGPPAALFVLVAAVLVSRWFLPASANVNAAHSIPSGWQFLSESRGGFIVAVVALVAMNLGVTDRLARVIARRSPMGIKPNE